MTTAADWVSETEQHLDARTKQMDKLAAAITDTAATNVEVVYAANRIQENSLLSIDLELMYVWAFDPTSKIATVERGYGGSTAANHALGTLVYVNPVYPKFSILRALNQDLSSLSSSGLFTITPVEVTFNAATAAYDLTGVTNLEAVYAIEAKYPGLTNDWQPIRPGDYTVERNQNTTDFPSGFSLTLRSGGMPGFPVRVLYTSRFTVLPTTTLATDVSTTNLPTSAFDIPPLGAAARLVSPREVARNDTTSQGDSRRAEEVPPNAVRGAAAELWNMRLRRIGEEKASLRQRYPMRTR